MRVSVRPSVFTSPQIRVSVNNQQRATVRSMSFVPNQLSRLADLQDVDASNPDNNETLVYDASTNKYVIKTLPVVDGGNF